MLQKISTVEDVFQVTGRGTIVAPGIPAKNSWCIGIGDRLILKRPDGTELKTHVQGIETGGAPEINCIPLLPGPHLSKDQVPIGTEIWVDVPIKGAKISIHQFSNRFRNLIKIAQHYLNGQSSLAALNGYVLQAKEELKLAKNLHPSFSDCLDEWEKMINRRWNEWGFEHNPITEKEFCDWLQSQLDGQ